MLSLSVQCKAYVVFRGGGKDDSSNKLGGTTSKFLGKSCHAPATSNQTNSISLHQANLTEDNDGIMVSNNLVIINSFMTNSVTIDTAKSL